MWTSRCVSFRDAKGCDGLRRPLRFSCIRRRAIAKRGHCCNKKDEVAAYAGVVVGEKLEFEIAVADVVRRIKQHPVGTNAARNLILIM